MSIGNTSVQTAPNAMRKVPFITPSKCAGESHPRVIELLLNKPREQAQ
jgi:hypothetical protein